MPTAFDNLILGFGPSIYLPLQETSGSVANDISGNGINGTYGGVAGTDYTLAASTLVTGNPAVVNMITANGKVTVPFDTRLQAGAYSVGMMINMANTTPATRALAAMRPGAGWEVDVSSNTGLSLRIGSRGPGSGAGFLSSATTYLVVCTFDGFGASVWANARQIVGSDKDSDTSLVTSIATSGALTINPGAGCAIGNFFFIPNRALTALEVSLLYEYSRGNTSYTIAGFPNVPQYYVDPNSIGGTPSPNWSLFEAESNPAKPFDSMNTALGVVPRDSIVYVRQGTYTKWVPNFDAFNSDRERTSTATGVVFTRGARRGGGWITFMPYPGENPQMGAIQPSRSTFLRFQGFQNMVMDDINGMCTQFGAHHVEIIGANIYNPVIASTNTEVEQLSVNGATSYKLQYWTKYPQPGGANPELLQGTTATINGTDTAATIQSKLAAIVAANPRPADTNGLTEDASGGAADIVVTLFSGTDGTNTAVYTLTWTGQYAGQPINGPETYYNGFIAGDAADGGPAILVTNAVGATPTISIVSSGGYVVNQSNGVYFANASGGNHHHRLERSTVQAREGNAVQVSGSSSDYAHDIVVNDNTIYVSGARGMYCGIVDTMVWARNKVIGGQPLPATNHLDFIQQDSPTRNIWYVGNEGYGPEFLAQIAQAVENQTYFINNLFYNNDGPPANQQYFPEIGAGIGLYFLFNTVWGQTGGAYFHNTTSVQQLAEAHLAGNVFKTIGFGTGSQTPSSIRTEKYNLIGLSRGATYDSTDIVSCYSPGGVNWANIATGLPTVSVLTTGTTTYSYSIVSIDGNGHRALPGAAVTVTNGAATPNNAITWTASPGAASYDVLVQPGATGPWKKLTNVTTTNYTDNGSATPQAYALPTTMEGWPQYASQPPATTTTPGSGGPWSDPRLLSTDNAYQAARPVPGLVLPGFGWANLQMVGSVPTTDQRGNARNTSTPSMGAIDAALVVNVSTLGNLGPSSSWNGTAGSGGTAPAQNTSTLGSGSIIQAAGNFDVPLSGYLLANEGICDANGDLTVTVICDTAEAAWIKEVMFWCEGNTITVPASQQTISPITGAIGYSVKIKHSLFPMDGDFTVYAYIRPNNGLERRVGPLTWTTLGTGVNTITRAVRYVDFVNGSDANAGTAPGAGNAWKTLNFALRTAGSGAIVNCATGTYLEDLNTGSVVTVARPITVQPSSGNLGDVIIDRSARYVNNTYQWQPMASKVIWNKIQIEVSNMVQVHPSPTGQMICIGCKVGDFRNGPQGPARGYFNGQGPGQNGFDFATEIIQTGNGAYWAWVNSQIQLPETNAVQLCVNSTISTGCDCFQIQNPGPATYINTAADKRGCLYIRYHWENSVTCSAVGMTGLLAATGATSGTFNAVFTWNGNTYTTATAIDPVNDSISTVQTKLLGATRTGGTTFSADGGGAVVYSSAATLSVGNFTVIWSAGAASSPAVSGSTVAGVVPTFTAPGRCAIQWTPVTHDTSLAAGQVDPTGRVRILTGALTGLGAQGAGTPAPFPYVGSEQPGYTFYQHDAVNHVTVLQSVMGDLYALGMRAGDTAWVAQILHPDGMQLSQRTSTQPNYDNLCWQRYRVTGDYVQPMFWQEASYAGAGTMSTDGTGLATCTTNHSLQVNDFVFANNSVNTSPNFPIYRQARRVTSVISPTQVQLASDFTQPMQAGGAWQQGKSINNSFLQLCYFNSDYSYGSGGVPASQTTDQTQWQHGHNNVVLRQVLHNKIPMFFRTATPGFGLENVVIRDSIIDSVVYDASAGAPSSGSHGITFDTLHFNGGVPLGTNHDTVGPATLDSTLKPTAGVTETMIPKILWDVYGHAYKVDGTALVGPVAT